MNQNDIANFGYSVISMWGGMNTNSIKFTLENRFTNIQNISIIFHVLD